MVHGDDKVDDHRAQGGDRHRLGVAHGEGSGEEAGVEDQLGPTCAKTGLVLQIERHDADAAEARAMPEEGEKGGAGDRPEEDRADDRIEALEADIGGQGLGQGREDRHGKECLENKNLAHAAIAEPVEWQIHHEEYRAKVPAGHIGDEDREAGSLAGDKAEMGQDHDPDRGHAGAVEDALGILDQGMLFGIGHIWS